MTISLFMVSNTLITTKSDKSGNVHFAATPCNNRLTPTSNYSIVTYTLVVILYYKNAIYLRGSVMSVCTITTHKPAE